VWHHLSRLEKYFSNPSAIVSILSTFLYATRYGVRGLKEQKSARHVRMDDLLGARLRVSDRLVRHDCCFDGNQAARTVLFSQVSGALLTVDARVSQLLGMCDGHRSMEEIATESAASADTTKEFIIGYSRALDRLRMLSENGFLESLR